MILLVDCCIRGEDSATRRWYEAYLETRPETDVQRLELDTLGLRPLDRETLGLRDALCARRAFDHEIFRLAHQFRDAEEILIAAPFWDLSFPAALKVYLERVSVAGLTFGYTAEGRSEGYCRAKRILYFATCGGFAGERHLGYECVKALGEMLGIPECIPYILEGLDIDPGKRAELVDAAIARLKAGAEMERG